jgi:thiamine kinase-like enzyme
VVVQEFAEGDHPDPSWVDEHIVEVGQLVSRFHSDEAVRSGVGVFTAADAVTQLAQRASGRDDVQEIVDAISGSAAAIPHDELCLTHGDPNTRNLIRSREGRLSLVDWDEARLSDPVRDIGQVLWWYVRRSHWAEGLRAVGLSPNPEVLHRVHWWAAAESLDVCLQHLERGNERAAADFALDARAASRDELNPRAWWAGAQRNA